MKAQFTTILHHLTIEPDLGHGDKINDTTFLTNNEQTIKNLIAPEFVPDVGIMEASSIASAKAVIYAKEEIPRGVEPEQHLLTKLGQVSAFLTSMWLYKDNSVNQELGFLFYTRNGRPTASSNFIALRYSDASGKFSLTRFSREELRDVRAFYRNRMLLETHPFERLGTQLTKGTDRASRAFLLVQGARCNSDLGLKVSMYCSALEALFATSQAELAHQLSERVAYFLEKDPKARVETYRKMKKAYSVRSKIVHGDVIRSSAMPELIEVSKNCDAVLRRSIEKVLTDEKVNKIFRGKSEKLDNYMIEITLGGNP